MGEGDSGSLLAEIPGHSARREVDIGPLAAKEIQVRTRDMHEHAERGVAGTSVDDRAGCAVQLEVARALAAREVGGSNPVVAAVVDYEPAAAGIDEQPYAVLCVQGGGQPYGALVAFAFSQDLRHAVFVTPVATRKYRLLSECDHVALVIDNRPNKTEELSWIALTSRSRSDNGASCSSSDPTCHSGVAPSLD